MFLATAGANIVEDLKPVTDALTGAVSPAQIALVISAVIGVGMGFVLTWFGIRKGVSIFKKAVMKGKISA